MTENINPAPPAKLTSLLNLARSEIIWSVALSLFWVIFIWGFWDQGVYALGLNAFVYLAGLAGLFVRLLQRCQVRVRDNLVWLVPSGLIIISFAIYENPFLKIISLLVLPAAFAVCYNYGFI